MRQGLRHTEPLIRPIMVAQRCIGCKTCIRHCKSNVLSFERTTQRVRVKDSPGCPSACRTCARLCPTGAVTFSDEEAFVTYLKKRLDRIRHELVPIDTFLTEAECERLP